MSEAASYEGIAGDLLRSARAGSGLTQAELAGRAGVSRGMVSSYENGRRQPTLASLIRLIEAAGAELHMRIESSADSDDTYEGGPRAGRPFIERRRYARDETEPGG